MRFSIVVLVDRSVGQSNGSAPEELLRRRGCPISPPPLEEGERNVAGTVRSTPLPKRPEGRRRLPRRRGDEIGKPGRRICHPATKRGPGRLEHPGPLSFTLLRAPIPA